jgi:hypothetical protein
MSKEAAELRDYMSELSEDYYCAGWLIDLEYSLWHAIEAGTGDFNGFRLTEEEVKNLKTLSATCAGWIVWNDESAQETFVPLAEWEKLYKSRSRAVDGK